MPWFNVAKQGFKPSAPTTWSSWQIDTFIKKEVTTYCQTYLQRVYGQYLLKIGDLSAEIATDTLLLREHLVVSRQPLSGAQHAIRADVHDLPLQESSIDAIIMVAEQNYSADPHQLMREINRVIRADGYLCLVGTNHFSLSGLLRVFNANHPFAQARAFSYWRIREWLHVLGFEVQQVDYLGFGNIYQQSQRSTEHNWWQRFCRRYLPFLGGMYIILAQKKTIPLTLELRPSKALNPRLSLVASNFEAKSQPKLASKD